MIILRMHTFNNESKEQQNYIAVEKIVFYGIYIWVDILYVELKACCMQ